MITVYLDNPHTSDDLKIAITEHIRNVDHAILNTVFENTIWRFNKRLDNGGGNLNITYNFLFCSHQLQRYFLITLYYVITQAYNLWILFAFC
jgi:hypothetical protein